MSERVELKEQELEAVVGGHFYWWRTDDGTRKTVNDTQLKFI